MTSSDVLDTALAVQLAQASDILIDDLKQLCQVLERRAFEHKLTPTIGRSHGIHAEPVTFGLKLAQAQPSSRATSAAAAAAPRSQPAHQRRGRHLREHRPEGGGACRTPPRPHAGADLDPGHPARPPRDVLRRLGVIASSIERLATEIRHLQRTEVLEAEEYFSPGPEGLERHAAQAQSGADREPDRLARMVRSAVTARAGECRAVA
jgi:adenylosuccinate lyase